MHITDISEPTKPTESLSYGTYSIVALLSIIFGAISLVPFLGMAALPGLVLSIITILRKLRPHGWIGLMLSILGLVTSPLLWALLAGIWFGGDNYDANRIQHWLRRNHVHVSIGSDNKILHLKHNHILPQGIEAVQGIEKTKKITEWFVFVDKDAQATTSKNNLKEVAEDLCKSSRECKVYFWDQRALVPQGKKISYEQRKTAKALFKKYGTFVELHYLTKE